MTKVDGATSSDGFIDLVFGAVIVAKMHVYIMHQ